MLRNTGKIDFDDMLLMCYDLFVQRPDILQAWQRKFQYILVDEFQDINRIQYEIVRMLALPENTDFKSIFTLIKKQFGAGLEEFTLPIPEQKQNPQE